MNCPLTIPPIVYGLLCSSIKISRTHSNHNLTVIGIGRRCLFVSSNITKITAFKWCVWALAYVYVHFIYLDVDTNIYQAAKIQIQKGRRSDWCGWPQCAQQDTPPPPIPHPHPRPASPGEGEAPRLSGRFAIDLACTSILICLSKYL